MEAKDDSFFSALFIQLVSSLTEAAMVQMGKIVDPLNGKSEHNLPMARNTIDVLRMLNDKTRNNLSEAETRMLEQNLLTLQMNYVIAADPPAKNTAPDSKLEKAPGEPLSQDQANTDSPPGSRPGENN